MSRAMILEKYRNGIFLCKRWRNILTGRFEKYEEAKQP